MPKLRRFRPLLWLLLASWVLPLTGRAAIAESMLYNGVPAYRLTDGKTEAVVVPSLSGRVMRFGTVEGPNWMWNAPPEKLKGKGHKNYGGDKTFVGPHPEWATFGKVWPPDASWDGEAHSAEVLPEGRLRTTGDLWRGFGMRVIREYFFNAAGEFVIVHTLQKIEGEPRQLAIWPVTQAAPPDAVFIPLNDRSAYAGGFHPYGPLPPTAKVEVLPRSSVESGVPSVNPRVLKLTPQSGIIYKVGADATVPAIAAVKGNSAFLQRADLQKGQYPDGAESAGMTVEYYNHWDAGPAQYVELELLSPLFLFKPGDSKSFTTRWSLHALPSAPHEQLEAIRILLTATSKP